MEILCVWEHNANDTLLHAANLPGAYTRGCDLPTAMAKMEAEVRSYLRWVGKELTEGISLRLAQDVPCTLDVKDADSDVLFLCEQAALTDVEYQHLKALALKSAADFHTLYASIPSPDVSCLPLRQTFYGQVPRTARQMYLHTRNVNDYYFSELGVETDHKGTILECRQRGFQTLEQNPDFLRNVPCEGSYGEYWNVRKMLRRFLWHDRIHAKAMYRMAQKTFGSTPCNPFYF